MTYHRAESGQPFCVYCKKPMSQWRANDECIPKQDSETNEKPNDKPDLEDILDSEIFES
jgi:hypothetical protein